MHFRRIDRIKGFTRETLIGLTANIETRQWRYLFNLAQKIAPEHPRSSSSDDVECFFSILRRCVGENFTMKQVHQIYTNASTHYNYFSYNYDMHNIYNRYTTDGGKFV